nr:hypothetical protein [Tanacetum cinerariifolium]
MSRDVLTVGSTMRISLLYRGEYSQWVERFMNYLEEQMDGEAMINSIKNGLPNDIYSLIDSKKTAKDLWDALARHMLGSEYGEQYKKAAVLNDKEKVVVSSDSEGSDADDFSKLKKITALLAKAFNLRNFYSKPTNNNLRTLSTSWSANKKQEFVKSDDKKVKKKDDEKKRDMSKVKCYNCKKEGHFAKNCKKVKVKDYEYYKTKMLLAKKDKDEHKVLSDSEASSSSAEETISEVSYYLSESESESEYETLYYYDNTTTYGLFVNHNDDQEIFHECENFPENLIESQIDHNESVVDHNDSKGIDKLIRKFNKKIVKCQKCIEKSNQQSKDFENQNKQTSPLKPYVLNVILEKIIIDLEDEVVNLLEKEKANLETIKSLKSKGFESSENVSSKSENQNENDCLVVENKFDKKENSKAIAPGMFKLSVSQCVSPISMSKTSCDSKNV